MHQPSNGPVSDPKRENSRGPRKGEKAKQRRAARWRRGGKQGRERGDRGARAMGVGGEVGKRDKGGVWEGKATAGLERAVG